MYRGYREDWHSTDKHQFDSHKGEDNRLFANDPDEQNIALDYIPADAVPVPVDILYVTKGWRVC